MIKSMAILCSLIVNTQYGISHGKFRYEILSTRIDGCNNETIARFQNLTAPAVVPEIEGFAFHKIAFQWYPLIGVISMWIPTKIISFLTGGQDFTNFNIQLLSPCVRGLLPKKYRHTELKLIRSRHRSAEHESGEMKFMSEMTEWISKKEDKSVLQS